MAGWPSGLRRRVKATVRKGVGSNPTPVTFTHVYLLHVCCKHQVLYRSLDRHCFSAYISHATFSCVRMCNRSDVGPKVFFIGCRVFLSISPFAHRVFRGMRRHAHPQTPLSTAHALALILSSIHSLSHISYMPGRTTPVTLTPTTCSCNLAAPET